VLQTRTVYVLLTEPSFLLDLVFFELYHLFRRRRSSSLLKNSENCCFWFSFFKASDILPEK